MSKARSSRWLALLATVLSLVWFVSTVKEYQSGVLLESEGGKAFFFDEVGVLEELGVSLLIADAGSSMSVFQRHLLGAQETYYVRGNAEKSLLSLQRDGRLTEDGLIFLSCVQWASGKKERAARTVENITDCEYSRSQTWLDLLDGKELEEWQFEHLEEELQNFPRNWVSCFLADQVVHNYHKGEVKNKEQLTRLAKHRRDSLFMSNAKISLLIWSLILVGVWALLFLWRKNTQRVATHPYAKVTSLWSLSLVLVAFVVGEFVADQVPAVLFAWTAWDLNPAALWIGLLGYVSTFQVLGSAVMLAVFYRPIRWQSIKKTFFKPVEHLWMWVLAAYTITMVFDAVLYQLPVNIFPVDLTLGFQWKHVGLSGLAMVLISAVIFAPVFEEIVFRGFLFTAFQNKFGLHLAAVASAVIFAGVHFYGVQDLIAVGFFGLVMAYLYHFTKSLTPCILCHALFNLVITYWNWLLEGSPESWWTP